jgi:hypothetical protein
VGPTERITLTCCAIGRVEHRRGEPGDHEQNSDDDDDTVQPVIIRDLSSTFFDLTPLSCPLIVLNLFSLCFARLFFLLFYDCFGASLILFGVIVFFQRFRIDIILCVWLPVTLRGPE